MSFRNKIRTGSRGNAVLVSLSAAVAVALATWAVAASAGGHAAAVGQPPPEWAENAG